MLTFCEKYSILLFVSYETRHARVAQRWSTSLPRRGSRVRFPSRALIILKTHGGLKASMGFWIPGSAQPALKTPYHNLFTFYSKHVYSNNVFSSRSVGIIYLQTAKNKFFFIINAKGLRLLGILPFKGSIPRSLRIWSIVCLPSWAMEGLFHAVCVFDL